MRTVLIAFLLAALPAVADPLICVNTMTACLGQAQGNELHTDLCQLQFQQCAAGQSLSSPSPSPVPEFAEQPERNDWREFLLMLVLLKSDLFKVEAPPPATQVATTAAAEPEPADEPEKDRKQKKQKKN